MRFAPKGITVAQMKTHPRKSNRAPIPRAPAKNLPTSDQPGASTPNSCGPETPPPQWAWHYRTLLHLRDRLMRAYAEHSTEAAAPIETCGVNDADTAQEQLDRDVLLAELRAEDDELFEVDSALQRIRDGTYGLCEKTGQTIPASRLRAIPWTRYSLAAAQTLEQHATRGKNPRD